VTLPGILAYRELIAEVQKTADKLESIHKDQLCCQPGCFECCVNLSVFRVEFDSISDAVQMENNILNFDKDMKCGFLKQNLCSIYQHRPLICRTHGLPILFLDDNKKWQVDFCEKNFLSPGSHIFNANNTLNIEQLNLRLYTINQEYCLAQGNNPDQRIDLCSLVSKRKMFE